MRVLWAHFNNLFPWTFVQRVARLGIDEEWRQGKLHQDQVRLADNGRDSAHIFKVYLQRDWCLILMDDWHLADWFVIVRVIAIEDCYRDGIFDRIYVAQLSIIQKSAWCDKWLGETNIKLANLWKFHFWDFKRLGFPVLIRLATWAFFRLQSFVFRRINLFFTIVIDLWWLSSSLWTNWYGYCLLVLPKSIAW